MSQDDQRQAAPAPPTDQGDAENGKAKPARKLSPTIKWALVVGGILVILAVLVWFIRYETRGKYYESTDDATIAADAVIVAPKISGYVEQVAVIDNQDVTSGTALVRIDPRDYRAKSDSVQAQIAQALASADSARAAIAEQYAMIAQSRAELAAAKAKAAHDAGEVARYLPLAASGAETRRQLAQLQADAILSADDARAKAAALAMQQRRIPSDRAQLRQAQAQAQGARAQLAAADSDVGATLIRAAINGRVGDKTVTVGQYVQAGTRLMSIVPLDQLYVLANFKETQLALMRAGQPATIKVDALDGTTVHGRVQSVSPGTGAQFSLIPPQNATGNFTKIVQRVPVRIAIDATPDARRLLMPGLSVTVTVDTIAAKGDLDHIRDQEKQREDARHHE